jgi:hypothetical protein
MKPETKLLGLEISALTLKPGQTRTHKEMESFCDAAAEVTGDRSHAMSWQRLWQIEQRALKKLRLRLCADLPEEMREAAMAVIFPNERKPADKCL